MRRARFVNLIMLSVILPVTLAWIRSEYVQDIVYVSWNPRTGDIVSSTTDIVLHSARGSIGVYASRWTFEPISVPNSKTLVVHWKRRRPLDDAPLWYVRSDSIWNRFGFAYQRYHFGPAIHDLGLAVPYWCILAIFVAIRSYRSVVGYCRRRAAERSGLCPNCSYDLRDNISGVCPECGTRASPPRSLC